MPKGTAHEAIDASVLGALTLVAALANGASGGRLLDAVGMEVVGAFAGGFLAGSLLLSPDLDMASSQSVTALRRWGPLRGLWVPYGTFFKHRGVSHSYLLGPLTRLAYVGAWGWGAWLLAQALGFQLAWVGLEAVASWPWPRLAAAAAVGVLSANWSHLVADGVRPFGGRKRPRRRRR